MAKLLCALVFAGLVFQASAWDWNPTHWIPNISIPNPFKWISNHTGWISKLNPLNWFGGNCDHCSLQAFPGPGLRKELQETLKDTITKRCRLVQ
ncbi:hypothetical protein TNIN_335841 [Trichonephila inaurata madagascariensis]|uniref:Uncharacterized protein n=1 Tax=Trichonephila inaurata madagascariensis TaxID=2747483 RepID=A0A8X6Y5S5_9ARAC|nr:hypothetical protein TNIN_335841 [Trichonephila inaurata madagascariensis]